MEQVVSFLEVTITNPMLALLMAAVGGFAMWLLQALFFIREILLYIYLYAMPLGVALAYGRLPVISHIAKRICMRFIPLAIMPLPVAILFRGYEILFSSGTDAAIAPESAFLSYLVAVLLPVFSLVLVWKLFAYASPLTTSVIGGVTKGAATVGAVAGAATVAGPYAAVTAAKWGPKAAAGQIAGQKLGSRGDSSGGGDATSGGDGGSGGGGASTAHDNVASDAYGPQGVPPYRRTGNDPRYY